MKLFEEIILFPYIFHIFIAIIIVYTVIHQYRVDKIIKNRDLKLNFSDKLFLFRVPFFYKNNDFDDDVYKEIKKLAKEYFFVHLFLFLYLLIIIVYYLVQAFLI